MPRVTPLVNNLNGGEFDARMVANTNFGAYPKGSAELINLLLLEQGGLTRRPGTKFVKEVKDSTDTAHRLIQFVFNDEQAYILEFGDQYIRFYTDLGRLEDPPGTPVEVVSPWTSAQLAEIDYAQRADIMNLVHPEVSPRRLSRTDNLTWTLDEIEFIDGPYLDENTTTTTITPSGTTGSVTLTASAPLFEAGHVGSLWSIGRPSGVVDRVEWAAGQTIAINDQRKYDGINGINVYIATSAGTTGDIPPEHLEGIRSDGDVDWDYYYTDIGGYAKITGFTSSTVVDADVKSKLGTALATTFWSEGAWSSVRGFPRVVTFHEQRGTYASTAFQPQTVWLSKSRELDNFLNRTNQPDDDPIDRTIDSKRPDLFKWMESATRLFLGGSDSISALRGSSIGEPITPKNVTKDLVNSTPSANVDPILTSTALLFIEKNGRRLNELLLTGQFEGEPLQETDMSVLNQTILKPGVTEMAWQARPHRTLWCLKSDGKLASFVYNRQQEVIGWGGHLIAGAAGEEFGIVRTIASIPGSISAGTIERNEIWMIVERVIDGTTVKYIEYLEAEFEDDTDVTDQFFVDSGLTFSSGTETDVITGLDHLEGETVQVLADGSSHPDVVVTSGQIQLERDVNKAQIGLKAPYLYEALKMEIGSQTGTSQGKLKRINEVLLVLDRTFNASVGPDKNQQQDIYRLEAGQPMDLPRPLLTGEYLEPIEGDWQGDPRLVIAGDHAGNFTLLAIRPTVTGAEV